jgi:Leucine-rich repeat (LRR) protein
MFDNASSFNQDISNWCVTDITSEPSNFSTDSPLAESNTPVWGTCPSITAIPDANFEKALIGFGLDSGEIDGQVLTANINGITGINLDGSNISDLTGIEGFTALEYLRCDYNQLTRLDVSQNTALNYLECHNNALTSLDVSQNTALNYLECHNNALESLDVSQNTALETLVSYNNQLTELIVSSNPALKILTCNSNNLTTLDLSSNTNLEILSVDNNQLETLDIRNGNNAIISYFISTNNPNLSCIFVDNADYSSTNWTDIDPTATFVEDETACSALSVGDHAFELGLSVYPNPTSDIVYIDGNYTQLKVIVYDILGKQVMNKPITNSIDISHLGNGVYILQLSDGVKLTTQRIIKK